MIILRKKTILPIKRFFFRKKQASRIEYPSVYDFLLKADEMQNDLLKAERESDSMKIAYQKGAMSIIDWINSYGDSKEKGNPS